MSIKRKIRKNNLANRNLVKLSEVGTDAKIKYSD